MKKSVLALLVLFLALTGCTSAQRASLTDLGKPTLFVSHSGACVNYIGISEGRIQSVSNGDGWEFVDKKTGKRVRVGGDSLIIEANQKEVEAYLNGGQQALLQLVQEEGTIIKVPENCR